MHGPITETEALASHRRLIRLAMPHGRRTPHRHLPTTLPPADALRTSSIFRLPPRTMAFVKARAELEGRTVTSIVEEALRAYSRGDVVNV